VTSFAGSTWFIALPVGAGAWFESVPTPPDQTRLFHPDDLHLTIAFLDRCGEERALAAWEVFRWPASPMTATLGEVVPLGNPRRPSALSALLDAGRREIEGAMAECRDRAIAAAEAPKEERAPKAHVTLARISQSAGAADRRRALAWAESVALGAPLVSLDRVALYASSPGAEGRRYKRVRELTLPLP
jgi:2'-5' RNA ligase